MTALSSVSRFQTQPHVAPQTFGWLANEKSRERMKEIYEQSENIPYKDLEHVKSGVCYTRTISSSVWGQVKGFFEGIFNWCGQMFQRYVMKDPEKPLFFELRKFEDVDSAREFEKIGLKAAGTVKGNSYRDLFFMGENRVDRSTEPVMTPTQECLRSGNHVLVIKGKVDGRNIINAVRPALEAIYSAKGPGGNEIHQD